ncbi:uncharacterized protein LOC123005341 [Tribolium madens]|uniref:uncharacterized protein LOC123005341 n=1 Tax=Tribolium madens TaxID=41895 RepID=UPI001CF729A8|nr:uncharacterized protein LOC123005341 [Tribolium madens]
MVEDSTSDDNTTTNKGVNARSESLPVRVHRFSEAESSSTNAPRGSLSDIKNDIQNVLDLMGPTTPDLTTTHYTSSDADNDEFVLSSLDTRRPRLSSGCDKCPNNCCTSNKTSNSKTTNQDSVMADIGTCSLSNFEHFEDIEPSCCDHAHLGVSPECLCMIPCASHGNVSTKCEGYYIIPNKSASKLTVDCKKRNLLEWIKNRSHELLVKKQNYSPCDLYKINICGQEDDAGPPKRVVFDLVDGIPRPTSTTVATNTIHNPVEKTTKNNETNSNNCNCSELKSNKRTLTMAQSTIQKNVYYDSEGNTRVDYYYFDHGNAQYLHTTDTPPVMKCEIIAEKTEKYTTKFWAEFFASIHIGVSFCVSFILQLFKFLLYSIFRPIFVGLMQMWSDYLFKPFLTTLFNGVIQPFLIFLYNIATSVRDLCDPIAEAFGYYCRELAVLLRAIRLCSYKKNGKEDNSCDYKKKYKCEC